MWQNYKCWWACLLKTRGEWQMWQKREVGIVSASTEIIPVRGMLSKIPVDSWPFYNFYLSIFKEISSLGFWGEGHTFSPASLYRHPQGLVHSPTLYIYSIIAGRLEEGWWSLWILLSLLALKIVAKFYFMISREVCLGISNGKSREWKTHCTVSVLNLNANF